MKRLLCIALAICVLSTIKAAHYELQIQEFTKLTVVDGINVVYSCNADSAGWAVFDCDPELASCLTFTNNRQHLKIQTTAEETPIASMPTVTVYSSYINYFENTGDSLLSVRNLPQTEKLKIVQIGNGSSTVAGIRADKVNASVTAGNGTITLCGSCSKLKLSNIGTGIVQASDLEAQEVSCSIFGPGPIYCNAEDCLKVYGAGKGTVYYTGTHERIKNRSIGVRTEPAAGQ